VQAIPGIFSQDIHYSQDTAKAAANNGNGGFSKHEQNSPNAHQISLMRVGHPDEKPWMTNPRVS